MTSTHSHGLHDLRCVPLSHAEETRLRVLFELSTGPLPWRRRKENEARELFALQRLAPRLQIEQLDLGTELRAVLRLRVALPCRADGDNVVIAREAVLGLRYLPAAMTQALPGTEFLSVFFPARVWHPNTSARGPDQRLCLGPRMLPGVPVRELVLMAYGALTMQTVQLDAANSAGVLNPAAAEYWQAHVDQLPLSSVPFLGTEDLAEAGPS